MQKPLKRLIFLIFMICSNSQWGRLIYYSSNYYLRSGAKLDSLILIKKSVEILFRDLLE